jgi:transcriptional regulator with XRE-family HTH domain
MTDQTTPSRCDSRALILFSLPLTIALGIGTGGALTAEYVKQRKDGIVFSGSGDVHARDLLVATQAEDLTRIKGALKLTVSELADCIGVSRQSVYNWKSGSEIKAKHAAKLENLKKASDVILAANMDVSAFSLARKLPGGKTLLETISGDGDGRVAAQSLLQMLNQESAERKALDERLAGRKQPVPYDNTFGA